MLRTIGVVLAMVATEAAVARTSVSEFDGIAATAERIDIHGVPAWRSGRFRIGTDGTQGTVRRKAVGRSHTLGRDAFGNEDVRVTRYGTLSFAVEGPAVGRALAGECRYDRAEQQGRSGSVTLAEPTRPLLYRCDFRREGQVVGTLELIAIPERRGLAMLSGRRGDVRFGGVTLAIASLHELGRRRVAVDMPVGYRLSAGGVVVGAVDISGATRKRLALPRDPARREASLAAALALALFWDPGDTDD